ncbi:2-hydroxyacyl-CoA dehydratase [Herbivorax sp. ANBcel31]|uniref:2-hydroxyacyl-CoA dehydratase family protein n=1 Tax=Herbivorax sp. ANBcel31 TaxID=3069754 RepID=UPI0027B5211E|nr:2-hydroxyacyl-CoA dehydratase [Herbivorax sp. ANBcel31]MDQ2086080.1 2-hydroxyacyl-CoA dehydratase [Herbivorax sp. ANBcel31]
MKKVGFTTSIPVETVFAADCKPVDINNIFVNERNAEKLLENAEKIGFPRNSCAWIKGMYSCIMSSADLDMIIGVVEGDCSNTRALREVLELNGVKSVPFSYPNSRDYNLLKSEILNLCNYFGINIEQCVHIKKKLDNIRKKLVYLDELTWKYNKASGLENHIWQVSSSDFNGDYNVFKSKLEAEILQIEKRDEFHEKVRIGYIGVPPIISDLYDFVETLDGRIVYNEVQRQFTMADSIGIDDVVETYKNFTYPYDIYTRLEDIKNQIKKRKIDGVIHYTQAFCFRGIEDIVIRKNLDIPVLTLEGDRPGSLDSRTKLRIESFIDMIG